jgi:hypothetical protein
MARAINFHSSFVIGLICLRCRRFALRRPAGKVLKNCGYHSQSSGSISLSVAPETALLGEPMIKHNAHLTFPLKIRSLLVVTALLMIAVVSQPAMAGDFDKGMTAYNNNDYAATFAEWRPLAEQG